MHPFRTGRVPLLVALALAPLGCASSSGGAADCSVSTCPPDASGSTTADAGALRDGSAPLDGSRDATAASDAGSSGPPGATTARMVAYVNVICGFGSGARSGECLATPDPTVNYVQQWEEQGTSPITHYILSFLSFQGSSLQTDPGEIWASGGGSTTDFTLEPHVAAALTAAKAHGKKVFLSIGGAAGSSGFLSWWTALGGSSGVAAMGQQIQTAVNAFQQANGFGVDGIDVDIELGGAYAYGSQDYDSTRDLINAVPESLLVAFVPQVGNGLCAAPVAGDPLTASQVLGGECDTSSDDDDSAWSLANLDQDCKRSDGTPKLDYWGIQYYNAGQATCCGGGPDTPTSIQSIAQSYENLANGWLASNATTDPGGDWPGPWPAFAGIGADRLVLGKPACQGCAGSNYLAPADMQTLIASLDGKLAKPAGGILFWDLGRIFGDTGSQCVSGTCQPSWGGGGDVQAALAALQQQMAGLSLAQ
ncbi:MAG: glycosyl hydrolase family 18 protein [Polyangiaceae bacterium]